MSIWWALAAGAGVGILGDAFFDKAWRRWEFILGAELVWFATIWMLK